MAGVGNGTIDVGNQTPTHSAGQPVDGSDGCSERRIDRHDPVATERPKVCIAMTQQSGDGARGNQSAPQKLVHLVGCRDRKARAEPWVRPSPVKR
jgi:hypothetical protein